MDMLLELPSKRTFASRERFLTVCSLPVRMAIGFAAILIVVIYTVFVSQMFDYGVFVNSILCITLYMIIICVFFIIFYRIDELHTGRCCFDNTYDSVLLKCREEEKFSTAMQQLKDYSTSRKFHAKTLVVVAYESMVEAFEKELSTWQRDGWIYRFLPGTMSWDFQDIHINDLEGKQPTHEVYNAINDAPFVAVDLRLPKYQWTPNTNLQAPKTLQHVVRAVTIGRAHAHQSCIALLPNELLFKVFECL